MRYLHVLSTYFIPFDLVYLTRVSKVIREWIKIAKKRKLEELIKI